MDSIIDFTNCKRAHTTFGGSDRKFGVIYNDETYMLKFPEHHAKKHEVSTSYINCVFSEYISSHISQSVGLPTHETVLGIYKDQIVVGCKDFRKDDSYTNIEFAEYIRSKYDSKEVKRLITIQQIYDTLSDLENDIPKNLQEQSIERYWDTFIVDSLVGNFDRHVGNWGYLAKKNQLELAPVYDYGSTLYPQLSDAGAKEYIKNNYELYKRCLIFPSPALAITKEKVGKVGYYDMLASNYDHNCTKAALKIIPKVDMGKIQKIIDNTPFITEVKKDFYKTILQYRKTLILDRAYVRCFYQDYDKEALNRINEGNQFSEDKLKEFLSRRKNALDEFNKNETFLTTTETADYIINNLKQHKNNDKKELVCELLRLVEVGASCFNHHCINHIGDLMSYMMSTGV